MAPRGRKPKEKIEPESTEFENNRFIILPGKHCTCLYAFINNVLNGTNILYVCVIVCFRCFNKR